jgi:hypothetical protein
MKGYYTSTVMFRAKKINPKSGRIKIGVNLQPLTLKVSASFKIKLWVY